VPLSSHDDGHLDVDRRRRIPSEILPALVRPFVIAAGDLQRNPFRGGEPPAAEVDQALATVLNHDRGPVGPVPNDRGVEI
jgi:hypothetical protein